MHCKKNCLKVAQMTFLIDIRRMRKSLDFLFPRSASHFYHFGCEARRVRLEIGAKAETFEDLNNQVEV